MPSRHVLLIAGNERRFIEDVQKFADFLAPSRPRLTRIHAAYWEERAFARAVEATIAAAGRAPLLIVYSGHGSASGWGFSVPGTYPYPRLCDALAARPGGVALVVNACCHAMAFAKEAERRPSLVGSGRLSVIAACDADKATRVPLVEHVLGDWTRGKAFMPKTYLFQSVRLVLPPDADAGPDEVLTLPDFVSTVVSQEIRDHGVRRWGPERDLLFAA